MKLGKTSWLILSLGIFIVIVVSLALTRSQQLQKRGQLGEELGVAEKRLNQLQVNQLRDQQGKLQGQLDGSTMNLKMAKEELRQTIESIDVTDKFFQIAQSCGVEITAISSSRIQNEKIKNVACSVINLNTVVVGEVPDLISFIIKLNDDFTTGVVKSAQISIPETAEKGGPSATIVVAVYTYKGE